MIEKSSAVIINEKKQLLVVKKKTNMSHFILPGGKLEKEELPIEALIRELDEEINIKVVSAELINTVIEKSQFEDSELKMYLFFTTVEGEIHPKNEIQNIEWIDIHHIKNRDDLATGIIKYAIPYILSMEEKNE